MGTMGWDGVGWGWDSHHGVFVLPFPSPQWGFHALPSPTVPSRAIPKPPWGSWRTHSQNPPEGLLPSAAPSYPPPPHPKTPSTGSPNLNCGVAPHAIPTPTGGSWPHPFPTPHGATRGGSHPPCPIPPPQLMGWGPKSPPVGLAAAFIPATKGGEEEEEAVGGGGRWGWLPRGAGGTHAAR